MNVGRPLLSRRSGRPLTRIAGVGSFGRYEDVVYRFGTDAGGRTRGSSLIVPVGSRVSTFFSAFFGCVLPAADLLFALSRVCPSPWRAAYRATADRR